MTISGTVVVAALDPGAAGPLVAALARLGAQVRLRAGPCTFDAAERAFADLLAGEPLSAVVVSTAGPRPALTGLQMAGWADTLLGDLRFHAAWNRAAIRATAHRSGDPLTVVNVAGVTGLGLIAAEALAQLDRCIQAGPDAGGVRFCSVAAEEDDRSAEISAALAAQLAAETAPDLSAGQFVVAAGAVGLRSMPTVKASIAYSQPPRAAFLDAAFRRAFSASIYDA